MERKALIEALTVYGEAVRRDGWDAGEAVILAFEPKLEEFRRWAWALAILLRCREILEDDTGA